MELDLHKKLLARAEKLLNRRPYSREELAVKLAGLGGEEEIRAVLNHLQEVELLNDVKYAYNLALYRLTQQGWGPDKVREDLLRHKVAPEHIEAALDGVCRDVSFEAILADYVDRHCRKSGVPSEHEGVQKLFQHLRRRGFPEDQIQRTLRQKLPPATWRRFETGE